VSERYDSTNDTLDHISRVQDLLNRCIRELSRRSVEHDLVKLSDEEKPYFDQYTPLLRESKYGSKEYFENLELLRPALDHHYEHCSHHPEHYCDGIKGMNLFDLMEMFCDWQASLQRSPGGSIERSIELGQDRFGYSDELKQIFLNSIETMKDKR